MGGGVGKTLKKVAKKVEEKVGIEKAVSFAFNPAGELVKKVAGDEASLIFNPATSTVGESAAQYADAEFGAPIREQKAFEAQMAKDAAAQKASLERLGRRKAQEGAEREASEALLNRRSNQRRRMRGRGRGSTILAQKLGAGAEGRKTLLGL